MHVESVDKPQSYFQQDIKREEWVPKKLNWTTILYDENIFIDSELYRKWDRNLFFEGKELLEKDLIRTRSNQQYFRKQSTRQLLKRITTFYCIQNRVNYQQGLLEVVIPFALLKRKDFETRKCYAYFNSFMKKYFPKVLTQKTIENRKQLPHAILAITLIQMLLKFHEPVIYQIFKSHEIPLSMVVTQQILTVFAKNVDIPLVYQIFNFFMNKKDKKYLLYMCIALISLKKEQIIATSEDDQLHSYVNKNLKTFKTVEDLELFFEKSEEIQLKTPKSFDNLSKKLGFCEKTFFTFEDYQRMMKFEQSMIDFIIPVYRQQIDEDPDKYIFLLLSGQIPSKKYHFLRLNITEKDGKITFNSQLINKIPKNQIIVIGYTLENEKQQKLRLSKFVKQLNETTNYEYKMMMFQDRLQTQKICQIY